MNVTYQIKTNNGLKTVQGVALTPYFAVQQEAMGWLMTHIPSGRCVVSSPFDSKELALGFAQMLKATYQDALADPKRAFIWLRETESQEKMAKVIETIATENPAIVTGHYLDTLMQ
jgi:hypothetical protein